MKVSDVMTENPACCRPDAGLQQVARLMLEHDCGCIPVVDSDKSKMPVGMITDRDITCRVVAHGKDPAKLTARDAMTSTVLSIPEDAGVDECARMMEEGKVRRIAVVDADGSLRGIVSQADIARHAGKERTAEIVQEVSKSAGGSA